MPLTIQSPATRIMENPDNYDKNSKSPKRINQHHDKLFKETFSDLEVTKDFMEHYLPVEFSGIIDIDSVEIRKDSFIEEDLKDAYADLLFSVQLNNKENYFYFLFEHKSSKKKTIAFDLLHYMQQIWKTLIEKEKVSEIPHIIPILFYHGDREWSDVRTIGDWTKGYHQLPEEIQRYSPNFEFVMVDMSPKVDVEIVGGSKLRAFLEISRYIFVDDKEVIFEVLRFAERLLINDDEKYFLTIITYVFSARRDIQPKEMKKQLVTEGGVKMMSLQEILKQTEREEAGIDKARTIAKELFRMDMSEDQIKKATKLSSEELTKIKKELENE